MDTTPRDAMNLRKLLDRTPVRIAVGAAGLLATIALFVALAVWETVPSVGAGGRLGDGSTADGGDSALDLDGTSPRDPDGTGDGTDPGDDGTGGNGATPDGGADGSADGTDPGDGSDPGDGASMSALSYLEIPGFDKPQTYECAASVVGWKDEAAGYVYVWIGSAELLGPMDPVAGSPMGPPDASEPDHSERLKEQTLLATTSEGARELLSVDATSSVYLVLIPSGDGAVPRIDRVL